MLFRSEEELKMLFMQTGKIDVWNKIKERQAAMDLEDAKELSALKKAEKEAKAKEEEMQERLDALRNSVVSSTEIATDFRA